MAILTYAIASKPDAAWLTPTQMASSVSGNGGFDSLY
jgi:hypothetical protein